MELISIVHELRIAKGSKQKLKILERHKNNELWKKFLKYTYDPFISYGVSAPKDCTFDLLNIDNTMFDLLDMLVARHATGKSAKEIALSLSTSYGEISRIILGRSLKAGVSITTINKVYPDLITTWESMKGKDVPITEFPVMTSIKYDGVKVFVKVQESGIALYSSSGLEFKLDSLSNEFSTAMFGVYEGELTHKEGKIVHRLVITGHLNSLLAGTKAEIPNYKYRIYDWIALDEWDSRESKTQWWIRQKLLKSQFETGFQDSANVTLVEQHFHDSLKEVIDMFESLTTDGYEGTMSRYATDVYAFSRVDRLIKKKSIRECVVKCVGIIPHSNPSKGNIGSLILEGIVTDKDAGTVFIKVKTGSGLSKFDINCEPEMFINKDVEMLYNSITKTENGFSAFLPRYKRIVKGINHD